MRKKNITTEDLARMIKKGFDGTDQRFDGIDRKLDKHAVMLVEHTERLKDHTERLKRIETKLEGVVYRREYEELETRVKTLEKALSINPPKS